MVDFMRPTILYSNISKKLPIGKCLRKPQHFLTMEYSSVTSDLHNARSAMRAPRVYFNLPLFYPCRQRHAHESSSEDTVYCHYCPRYNGTIKRHAEIVVYGIGRKMYPTGLGGCLGIDRLPYLEDDGIRPTTEFDLKIALYPCYARIEFLHLGEPTDLYGGILHKGLIHALVKLRIHGNIQQVFGGTIDPRPLKRHH